MGFKEGLRERVGREEGPREVPGEACHRYVDTAGWDFSQRCFTRGCRTLGTGRGWRALTTAEF